MGCRHFKVCHPPARLPVLGQACAAKQEPAPALHHGGLPWPLVALRGRAEADAKHPPKQMTPGPLIPGQPSPAWSRTYVSGAPSVPVGKGSAASLLGAAGTAEGLIPRLPFAQFLLYVKEPQRRSKCPEVSLTQPEALSESDVLLSAAPGCGDGVIPTPSQPPPSCLSSRRQALGRFCGPLASLGTELPHRLCQCSGLQRSPAPC